MDLIGLMNRHELPPFSEYKFNEFLVGPLPDSWTPSLGEMIEPVARHWQ